MYDMDDDGWFEPDGKGTAYYISDSSGTTLLHTGTLCRGLFSYQCWQHLDPGTYILRIGGALDMERGEHTWSFCGKTGGAMEQILFRVYEVSSPTAAPVVVSKPGPEVLHRQLNVPPPPPPPPHPRPPELKCEVLLAYSKKRYCADPSISKINLKGHFLLRGMDNDTVIGAEDKTVLGQAVASILSVKPLTVQVESLIQSYDMSGRIVTFTISVDGLAGYNFRYYSQLEELLALLTEEMSSPSFDERLITAIQGISAISTADTNILKRVNYAMFLDLYLSNIGSKLKKEILSELQDQNTALTYLSASVSSSKTSSVSHSYSMLYICGVSVGLLVTLIVLGLMAAMYMTRGEKMSVMSTSGGLYASIPFTSQSGLDNSSTQSLMSTTASNIKYNNLESAEDESSHVTTSNREAQISNKPSGRSLPKNVSKVQRLLPNVNTLPNSEYKSSAEKIQPLLRDDAPLTKGKTPSTPSTTLNEIKILSDYIVSSKSVQMHISESNGTNDIDVSIAPSAQEVVMSVPTNNDASTVSISTNTYIPVSTDNTVSTDNASNVSTTSNAAYIPEIIDADVSTSSISNDIHSLVSSANDASNVSFSGAVHTPVSTVIEAASNPVELKVRSSPRSTSVTYGSNVFTILSPFAGP